MRTVLHINNDADGRALISELRVQAKAHNLMERAKEALDPTYKAVFRRIDLFGRLGRGNPMRHKYSVTGRRTRFYRAIRIALEDASYFAVYCNETVRAQGGGFKLR